MDNSPEALLTESHKELHAIEEQLWQARYNGCSWNVIGRLESDRNSFIEKMEAIYEQ